MAAKNRHKIRFWDYSDVELVSQKLLIMINLTMLSSHCAIPFWATILKAFEVEEARGTEA